MKLRLRVALVLLAIVLPMVTLFTFWRVNAEHRFVMERHAERIATRIGERPPERCERRPEDFRLQRRGIDGFGYNSEFQSQNKKAPPFPSELKRVERVEDPVHTHRFKGGSGATAVSTGRPGPCAYILITWTREIPRGPIMGPIITQSAALALLLVLTAMLIAAPLVRRIRRLQQAVEHSIDGSFDADSLSDKDEIGDLARAFKDSNRRIQETIDSLRMRDETLTEFVSNTTHDLAIPLTVLQHRLLRAKGELESDPRAEHIEAALQESHYISALVRNMGASARLERSQSLVCHEVDLVEILERVHSRHQPVAQWRHVDFNVGLPGEPVMVSCDSTLAEQALSNLVQNAIQYVDEGGHVSLILEEEEGVWCVRVLDDGPGVPDSLIQDLGTRGARSDGARNRNPGGQGFGLNITRKVCEAHGWKLDFENSHPGLIARICL